MIRVLRVLRGESLFRFVFGLAPNLNRLKPYLFDHRRVGRIRSGYTKEMPPSTFTVWPVMKSLSGEAKNNIAPTTSCGT